ncbi:hypothetical protein D018_4907B, partial [Vibrio parahaemolyticus VP2007-007]
GSRCRCTFPSY